MNHKFTPHPLREAIALSLILAAAGNPANAQPAETTQADEPLQVEEMVVRGIRSSLNTATSLKRNSSVIVDSIVAEDVGKFPDENVAESLQRVPGVSISRNTIGGEGSGISIRGLGPDFSRVFVNGRTVLNTGTSRQVNFSDLPSEIVGQLDVFKTPMASLTEGSIGGTVNVTTASPFDGGGGFRLAGSAQSIHNTLADDVRPRLSGQVSNTFADDTIGLLLGLNYQDRSTRQDQFDLPGVGWECVDESLAQVCAADTPLEERFFRPQFPRQFLQAIDSERFGLTGAIHFRPSDNVKLDFDVFYSSRDEGFNQVSYIVGTFVGGNPDIPISVITGTPVISENNSIVQLAVEDADLRVNHRFSTNDSDSLVLGFNGEVISGDWIYSGDVAYSESGTDGTAQQLQIFREIDGTWDYRTSSGIPIITLGDNFANDPLLNTGWSINNLRDEITFSDQDELNVRFDIEREFDGFIESVQFGARYTDGGLERDVFGDFTNLRENLDGPDQPARRFTVEEFQAEFDAPDFPATSLNDVLGIDNFGTELSGSPIPNWRVANLSDAVPFFYAGVNQLDDPNFASSFTISETTRAAYAQANFRVETALPISGNFGVRYVETDVETTGGSVVPDFDNLQTGSYSDFLPSLNVRLDLVPEELLLRFSAAKTIARPTYGNLTPATTLNVTTFAGTAGNPGLLPFRANQTDLSLEWYFGGEGNILAASAFYKDVESFIQTETILTTVDPALAAGIDPERIFSITRPGNGEGANVYGFELSYQQAFDTLPSPFDGLGALASYTNLSSNASTLNTVVFVEAEGLEGMSENAVNLTGYYEKYGWSFRMAYNWRDENLQSTGGLVFADNYGQLDAQVAYEINDRLTVTLDGKNLNGEDFRSFRVIPERLSTVNTFGSRYFLGLRARF